MSTPQPPRILFVCTGNTCRSPMAEAVAREAGMEAESAGVRASAGDRAAPHAVRAAERAGLDLSGHTPTGVASVDLSAYDRIVAVDPSVARRLQSEHDVDPDRLVTWSIPDPVGGSLLDYQHCLQHVQQAVDALQAS